MNNELLLLGLLFAFGFTILFSTLLFVVKVSVAIESEVKNIMSEISEYVVAQKAYNDRHGAAIDSIMASNDGLKEDVAELNRKIEALQNSPGGITPEDQAMLDGLQADGEALATKLEERAAALAELDAQTPPVVPNVP